MITEPRHHKEIPWRFMQNAGHIRISLICYIITMNVVYPYHEIFKCTHWHLFKSVTSISNALLMPPKQLLFSSWYALKGWTLDWHTKSFGWQCEQLYCDTSTWFSTPWYFISSINGRRLQHITGVYTINYICMRLMPAKMWCEKHW